MSNAKANVMRERSIAGLGGTLLFIALLTAYANHFHNSFHFDDAHTRAHVSTSASELIEQEISFPIQTFFGSVKKPDYGTTGAAPSQPTPLCFMPPNVTRRS